MRSPPWRDVKWVLRLSAAFAATSLAWSFLGLLSPTSGGRVQEYPFPGIIPEVGGHLLFGLVAGLATHSFDLIALCTALSLLIDFDHLAPALGLPIGFRLAHSIFFALTSAALLTLLFRRGGRRDFRIFGVVVSAISAHLSYDIVAGYGVFPLFFPISSVSSPLPGYAWIPIELAAITVNLGVFLWLRKTGHVY